MGAILDETACWSVVDKCSSAISFVNITSKTATLRQAKKMRLASVSGYFMRTEDMFSLK